MQMLEAVGFKGIVTKTGTDRIELGELSDSLNVYNEGGDLVPRPGFLASDTFTGNTSAPITLLYYRKFQRFYPQGGSGSGAIDNTEAISVSGTNTNPGFATGTQGIGGGGGSGGGFKHPHDANTTAAGGYLYGGTKVADSHSSPTKTGAFSDVLDVQDPGSGDVLVIKDTANVWDATTTKGGALGDVFSVQDIGGTDTLVVDETTILYDTGTSKGADLGDVFSVQEIGGLDHLVLDDITILYDNTTSKGADLGDVLEVHADSGGDDHVRLTGVISYGDTEPSGYNRGILQCWYGKIKASGGGASGGTITVNEVDYQGNAIDADDITVRNETGAHLYEGTYVWVGYDWEGTAIVISIGKTV